MSALLLRWHPSIHPTSLTSGCPVGPAASRAAGVRACSARQAASMLGVQNERSVHLSAGTRTRQVQCVRVHWLHPRPVAQVQVLAQPVAPTGPGRRKRYHWTVGCLARDANALHLNVGLDTARVPSALSVLFSSTPDTLCYQSIASRGSPAQDLPWARTRFRGRSNMELVTTRFARWLAEHLLTDHLLILFFSCHVMSV